MMGWVSILTDFSEGIKYLILPALSLAFVLAALVARMTRSSMLEVLREDYIVTALSQGTPKRLIVFKHALKNALAPRLKEREKLGRPSVAALMISIPRSRQKRAYANRPRSDGQ